MCSLCGTFAVDCVERKPTALISASFLTVFILLVGAWTNVYGSSTDNAGVYGTVASVFLCMGYTLEDGHISEGEKHSDSLFVGYERLEAKM